MPRQTSIQLTEATERQIEALRTIGYGTLTDIVRLAVDRMHQAEAVDREPAGPRVILTDEERDDIIAWATPHAVMQARELVNRAELIDEMMTRFDIPRHAAQNCIGHMILRLRKPN